MSDNPSAQDVEAIDVNTALPSAEDHEEILKNFAIIAGRIIVKYISTFEKIPSLTKEHITHCFYPEMSKQSKVVSCCNKIQLTLMMWPCSQASPVLPSVCVHNNTQKNSSTSVYGEDWE